MNKREARAEGFEQGYNAAIYCEVGDSDRREAGCECKAPTICEECLSQAAFESEENARQFSPWEFLAHDINECEDRADGLWEAYDAGVAVGIRKGAKQRIKT